MLEGGYIEQGLEQIWIILCFFIILEVMLQERYMLVKYRMGRRKEVVGYCQGNGREVGWVEGKVEDVFGFSECLGQSLDKVFDS